MHLTENITFDAKTANVKKLSSGYLAAEPRIARTGIQLYSPQEMNRTDFNRPIRVFRPDSEVFSEPTMRSFAHKPVTLDHPKGEMVDASNHRKYSRGHTIDPIVRDGEYVRCPVLLMDQEIIKAFEDGKNQLSVGYDCDIDWTPGVTDTNEPFDCVQRRITANHIAVVAKARGGDQLKIGDAMSHYTVRNGEVVAVDKAAADPQEATSQIECPNCGATISADVEVCPKCHTDLTQTEDAMPVMDERESAYQSWKDSLDTANHHGTTRSLDYFDPNKHPRNEAGEFTSGPSSGGPAGQAASAGGIFSGGGGMGGGLNISLPPPGGGGPSPIDPKRNVELLAQTSKKESESRVFASPEAAKAHAAQQAATWALHQSAHEQALEKIKEHKKKWEKAKVSKHTKTGPRSGFALTGPKSHHYSVGVDSVSIDGNEMDQPGKHVVSTPFQPQAEAPSAIRDQAYFDYIREIEQGWCSNKPATHGSINDQAIGDAETERARWIADMESAWKQKPARMIHDVRNHQPVMAPSPVTDQPATTADQAYAEYCRDLEQAHKRRA